MTFKSVLTYIALEDQNENFCEMNSRTAGLNSDPNGLVVSEFCTQVFETISTQFMEITVPHGAI